MIAAGSCRADQRSGRSAGRYHSWRRAFHVRTPAPVDHGCLQHCRRPRAGNWWDAELVVRADRTHGCVGGARSADFSARRAQARAPRARRKKTALRAKRLIGLLLRGLGALACFLRAESKRNPPHEPRRLPPHARTSGIFSL